jgi:hypothetical protein
LLKQFEAAKKMMRAVAGGGMPGIPGMARGAALPMGGRTGGPALRHKPKDRHRPKKQHAKRKKRRR